MSSPHRRLSGADPEWDDDDDDAGTSLRPDTIGIKNGGGFSGVPKTPHRKRTTMLPKDAPLMPSGAIARALYDFQDQVRHNVINTISMP